jgi:hypothetical protein
MNNHITLVSHADYKWILVIARIKIQVHTLFYSGLTARVILNPGATRFIETEIEYFLKF